MRRHLVSWQKEFADDGLVVVEITGGEQEPLDVVTEMVSTQNLKHPVLWDLDCRNHRNYGLKNWPVAYLVDGNGKVFWEGNPARFVNRKKDSERMKNLIRSKMAESKAKDDNG